MKNTTIITRESTAEELAYLITCGFSFSYQSDSGLISVRADSRKGSATLYYSAFKKYQGKMRRYYLGIDFNLKDLQKAADKLCLKSSQFAQTKKPKSLKSFKTLFSGDLVLAPDGRLAEIFLIESASKIWIKFEDGSKSFYPFGALLKPEASTFQKTDDFEVDRLRAEIELLKEANAQLKQECDQLRETAKILRTESDYFQAQYTSVLQTKKLILQSLTDCLNPKEYPANKAGKLRQRLSEIVHKIEELL